jgi:threonine synthase
MTSFERKEKRRLFVLRCFTCGRVHNIDDYGKFYYCEKCGGLLEVRLERELRNHVKEISQERRRGVWKYLQTIPLWDEANIVSLGEGDTILVECKRLVKKLGLKKSLFVKFEGQNPTGSFKDRGMTVGVSKAKEMGFRKVICASTGNTSASLAAYSARAGLHCTVLVPKGKIALGKISQAIAYGADILQVEGNFDACLRMAGELSEKSREILLLNSLNPFRIEGQKTAAFEIVEQLGFVPDDVILPVGNGGNISALWKGFQELVDFGIMGKDTKKLPRMTAVQAEGAAPIARAFLSGRRGVIDDVKDPHTEASAINIGSPVSWQKALAAVYDSGGFADYVSDDEIFRAQRLLAASEGLFVEPASAAPIAYLLKILLGRDDLSSSLFGKIKSSTIVCIATGTGLKDPNAILRNTTEDQMKVVSSDSKSLENAILTFS